MPCMEQSSQSNLSIDRVRISNYKSIGKCDVGLSRLTILVGRNGSGKSNFLDAIRFVADSLQTSIDHAIKSRGGIESVRRLSTGHPRNFAIELELSLSGYSSARYGFEIASKRPAGFTVKQEHLRIVNAQGRVVAQYDTEGGELRKSKLNVTMPPVSLDRLYLVAASGLPEFRELYDALSAMGFYNLNPEEMKELQPPDAGDLLRPSGSNIASVLSRITNYDQRAAQRIREFLTKIVPGITDVSRIPLGPKETLEFRQEIQGSKNPWKFYASSMSDGTLRALGSLIAVSQRAGPETPASVVGIEEPETALHPAAAGALVGALSEASAHTQIILTTHSADLLDVLDFERQKLLVVTSRRGTTEIAPVDKASLDALQKHLYTAGELHRMDQLEPNAESLKRQSQMVLFSMEEDDE